MSKQYANQQPSGFKNHVEYVAVIGAGGNVGRSIVNSLIASNHKVTAITRSDSKGDLPSGLHDTKYIDYNDHSSIVNALKGQQALVISMSVMAPPDTQIKLASAAVEAGVTWILPSEFGSDQENIQLGKDTLLGNGVWAVRKHIEKIGGGRSHWVGLSTSFWYEFSLGTSSSRYGFDFNKKEVTFFGEGKEKIVTTTWPQTGRAIAALLSLPVLPENAKDKRPYLSLFNDKAAYVSSFFLSQRDMLDSVLRVLGDKESDWKISHEVPKERYQRGMKMLQEGNMDGFNVQLYTRTFYPTGEGDFTAKLNNKLLGLPEESLDQATKVAIEMAKDGRVY